MWWWGGEPWGVIGTRCAAIERPLLILAPCPTKEKRVGAEWKRSCASKRTREALRRDHCTAVSTSRDAQRYPGLNLSANFPICTATTSCDSAAGGFRASLRQFSSPHPQSPMLRNEKVSGLSSSGCGKKVQLGVI